MDAEAHKQFVLNQLGPAAVRILEGHGIDVDSALTRILTGKARQEAVRDAALAVPQVQNAMTSELAYLSQSLDDSFGKEFFRRLSLIGLSVESINSLYHQEKIMSALGMAQERGQPWVKRYFFIDGITEKQLPKQEELTLSELILITDDATSAYVRDHHQLSTETWAAVFNAAVQTAESGGAKYAYALRDRVTKLGWSREQEGAFVKNESLLTERLKWGYHERPAWTAETTKLDLYKRP